MWISLSLSYLEVIEFLECVYSCLDTKFGKLSVIITSDILSAPSLSLGLQGLSFSSILFFFLVLQIWNFPLPYLQVHWLFGCLNRYLNPSSEIFISVILIFSSRISFKLSLGFPFFHISVLFMHCLLYFLHIFPIFFFWSIFKTVVL